MSAFNWTRVKEQDNRIKHRGPSAPGFEDSQWSQSDTKEIYRRSEFERVARRAAFIQLEAYRLSFQERRRKQFTNSQRLELLKCLQRSVEHCKRWGSPLSEQETLELECAGALLRQHRGPDSDVVRETCRARGTSSPPIRSTTNDRSHGVLGGL
jgi:hypothetical protein